MLGVKLIQEYENEADLRQALYREKHRYCVALRENGKFLLYAELPCHAADSADRVIQCDYETQINVSNLRLALYALYRPRTALMFDTRSQQAIILDIVPHDSPNNP